MNLRKWLHGITAMSSDMLAESQLEAAKIDLLEHQKNSEYYNGMVAVLQTRVRRLEQRKREYQLTEKPLPANVEEIGRTAVK